MYMSIKNISLDQKADAYMQFLEAYHKSSNYHEASNALCGRANCDKSIKAIMHEIKTLLKLKDTQSVKEFIEEYSEKKDPFPTNRKMQILHNYYKDCTHEYRNNINFLSLYEVELTQATKKYHAWKNALIISSVVTAFLIAIALVITALIFPTSLLTVGVCAGIVWVSLIATAAGKTDKYSQLRHQKEDFWNAQETSIRNLAHGKTTKLKHKRSL